MKFKGPFFIFTLLGATLWFCAGASADVSEPDTITAVLRLKERVSMAVLANSVMNPFSPRYREFYSPAEIRLIAGPTDADYDGILTTLENEGLHVIRESKTHLVVTVAGTKATFEEVFHTRFSAHGAFRTLATAVVIPDSLSHLVVSVSGLDNTRVMRPLYRISHDRAFSGVSLAKIRSLYGFNALYKAGLSGKGQHIAIATFNDFNLSDVTQYYQKQGINPAPAVDKVTFNGTPTLDTNSAIETEVDTEFSGALAQGAAIHVFTSATNDDAGELAMYTAILDDNRAKIVNYSWGGCEADLSSQHKSDMDSLYKRAVAQGVNIMVASGDSGSACNVGGSQQPTNPMPDFPAAHPSVVAVGGTTLDITSSTLSETAWACTGNCTDGGSGGGISTVWALPTWQKSLGSPYLKRSYPDVSFNASPSSGQAAWVQQKAGSPAYLVIGGTSIASPQWAGFLALVGEARASAGKPPIGYINPIIYGLTDAQRKTLFDDVTSGGNGKYTAGPGWDAVTGYGGMHAAPLLNFLLSH